MKSSLEKSQKQSSYPSAASQPSPQANLASFHLALSYTDARLSLALPQMRFPFLLLHGKWERSTFATVQGDVKLENTLLVTLDFGLK